MDDTLLYWTVALAKAKRDSEKGDEDDKLKTTQIPLGKVPIEEGDVPNA